MVPTTLLHVVVRFTTLNNIGEREGEGEGIRGEEVIGRVDGEEVIGRVGGEEGIGRVGGEDDAQEGD